MFQNVSRRVVIARLSTVLIHTEGRITWRPFRRRYPCLYSAAVFHCAGIIADNFADEVILEPTEIAKHYLKTFFFLDLISSLPLDYILVSVSPETSVNQLVHAGMVR